MSVATLILGESGTGKTTSLSNLDPSRVLMIQAIKKTLPFRSKGWKVRESLRSDGNIIQTDDSALIEKLIRQSPHDIVVVDDFQAVLVGEFMRRSSEPGYQKYTDIGHNVWKICNAAGGLAERRRIYIMTHTSTDDAGNIRMKTVGKMVDQYVVPESYFTIVLRTQVRDGVYVFSTQSSGMDCCKSPIGMFAQQHIPNDLASVDAAICSYYEIGGATA